MLTEILWKLGATRSYSLSKDLSSQVLVLRVDRKRKIRRLVWRLFVVRFLRKLEEKNIY